MFVFAPSISFGAQPSTKISRAVEILPCCSLHGRIGAILFTGAQSFLRNSRLEVRLERWENEPQRLRPSLKVVQDALAVTVFVVCHATIAIHSRNLSGGPDSGTSLGCARVQGHHRNWVAPIALTEAGTRSILSGTGIDAAPVLHWHGDTFELPAGAQRLASTAVCENQAYSIGPAVGVRFHPEVCARDFESWLICNAGQIAAMSDRSVASLREQARAHANVAAQEGQRWFAEWLSAKPAQI
jgi:hypothetical protein